GGGRPPARAGVRGGGRERVTQSRRVRGSDDLARLLADRQRLAIAGRLAVHPCTIEQLSMECGMTPRDLRRQLPKLVGAGLVDRADDVLSITLDLLRDVVATLPRAEPISPHLLL